MDREFILVPASVTVRIALNQAYIMLNAMLALEMVEKYPGMDAGLAQIAAQLPPERRDQNQWVAAWLHGVTRPQHDISEFDDYIAQIEQTSATHLRDEALRRLLWMTPDISAATLLADQQQFADFLRQQHDDEEPFSDQLMADLFALVNDPPALKQVMVEHLQWMWQHVLTAEWEHIKGVVQESVAAYQKQSYEGLTAYDAIRVITGRDVRGKWDEAMQKVEQLIFIPSPHLGPYLTLFFDDTHTARILFNARLPEGTKESPSTLSRSEILVRLSALADDSRLRILEIIAQAGELCAQDIITQLEMSQSAASRHLRQLSATGYLIERTRHGAKCYTLNADRITQTMQGLGTFLIKER